MALVDDIFKSIPLEILTDFGQDITLVKTVTPRTYDPSTGAVTGADTTVTTKGFIGNVSSRESEGFIRALTCELPSAATIWTITTQLRPIASVIRRVERHAKPRF